MARNDQQWTEEYEQPSDAKMKTVERCTLSPGSALHTHPTNGGRQPREWTRGILDYVAPRALFRDNSKWPPEYLNVRRAHRKFAFPTVDPRVRPQAATAATIMPSTDHFFVCEYCDNFWRKIIMICQREREDREDG